MRLETHLDMRAEPYLMFKAANNSACMRVLRAESTAVARLCKRFG